MSGSQFQHCTRDEFHAGFCPGPAGKAATAAGMAQPRAGQRAFRLAEMRRRLGITQAQVAARMGITQGRVSAIEHAKPGTTEPRTLAAYVEAPGGRLEITADSGGQRLAFTEPGPGAARPGQHRCPASNSAVKTNQGESPRHLPNKPMPRRITSAPASSGPQTTANGHSRMTISRRDRRSAAGYRPARSQAPAVLSRPRRAH
jgi:transcriptional regulator with XRE-family HTH domain